MGTCPLFCRVADLLTSASTNTSVFAWLRQWQLRLSLKEANSRKLQKGERGGMSLEGQRGLQAKAKDQDRSKNTKSTTLTEEEDMLPRVRWRASLRGSQLLKIGRFGRFVGSCSITHTVSLRFKFLHSISVATPLCLRYSKIPYQLPGYRSGSYRTTAKSRAAHRFSFFWVLDRF